MTENQEYINFPSEVVNIILSPAAHSIILLGDEAVALLLFCPLIC